MNLSAAGEVSGNVVFAGFGITAPEYNYDDYAGLDVKGKIVLLLRHEPQEFDEKSVFEGKVYTAHSQIFSKAANAKFHGAKAVLLVNDVGTHTGDGDDLEKFGGAEGPDNAGIEFVQVKANVVNQWLALSGKNLETIESGIDKDLHPESFALPEKLRLDMDVDIAREVKTVHNVVAYLPGETSEYVVIGAHYDHLGLGGQFSMAPSLDRNRASRRRRQRFRHRGRHRTGALVLAPAQTPARHSVSDLRGRRTGPAGLQLLRQPSPAPAQRRRRHDQHGHDRPHSRPQDLHGRRRHRQHFRRRC